jgi:hypothetical protein
MYTRYVQTLPSNTDVPYITLQFIAFTHVLGIRHAANKAV